MSYESTYETMDDRLRGIAEGMLETKGYIPHWLKEKLEEAGMWDHNFCHSSDYTPKAAVYEQAELNNGK